MKKKNNVAATLPAITIPQSDILPDNTHWQFRFNVPSSSSNRKYTIAQNKKEKYWACNCPGWKRHRHCHHLQSMSLPGDMKPHLINVLPS